jgi:hypothetical protein
MRDISHVINVTVVYNCIDMEIFSLIMYSERGRAVS